jgi:hypothetical protein
VKCKFCDWTRQAGSTLICEHVLGVGGAAQRCTPKKQLELYKELRPKLEAQREQKEAKKQTKRDHEVSDERAEAAKRPALPSSKQPLVNRAFASIQSTEIDDVIADFFYGCNIDFSVADHPRWRKVVSKLKEAPASYKPPPQGAHRQPAS